MVELPDEILLNRIEKVSLYLDKRSLEKVTSVIKPKYKLARTIILEQYLFNLLTRNKSACKRKLTLTIRKGDWENKAKGHLEEECSYCDTTKHDILDRDELLEKMRDKRNKFPFIARLCNRKYRKLEKLCKKARYHPYISKQTKEVIESTLSDIIDDKVRKLRLD